MTEKVPYHSKWFRIASSGTVLGVLLCFSVIAQADLLLTRGGDQFTGSLSRVANSILVFRTTLRGQMMVPMEEVQGLQTQDRWIVTLDNGDVSIGRLVSGGIASEEGSPVMPLAYGAIVEARQAPPLPEKSWHSWEESVAWKQHLAAGVRGNPATGGVDPYLQWEAAQRSDSGTIGLRLRFDVPDGEGISDELRGDLHLTSPDNHGRATFLDWEVQRDTDRALDWRTGLTLGMRYDFSEVSDVDVFGYLGLAAYYSRWEDRTYTFHGEKERTTDGAALRAHLGLGYRGPFLGEGEWRARLAVLPGISDLSSLRAEAETAFSYPLSDRLRLRFDVSMAYESDPAFNALDQLNTSLGAGIQFDF